MANDGKDAERRAMKILQAEGYAVHHCMKTIAPTKAGPRTKGEDIFGCVDLIAKNGGQTRWIQVTIGRNITDKVNDLAAVPWNDAHDSVEIWRWVGGRARLDRRYRNSTLRPRQYFQIYRRSRGYVLDKTDRVHALGAAGGSGSGRPAADDHHEPSRMEDRQHQP